MSIREQTQSLLEQLRVLSVKMDQIHKKVTTKTVIRASADPPQILKLKNQLNAKNAEVLENKKKIQSLRAKSQLAGYNSLVQEQNIEKHLSARLSQLQLQHASLLKIKKQQEKALEEKNQLISQLSPTDSRAVSELKLKQEAVNKRQRELQSIAISVAKKQTKINQLKKLGELSKSVKEKSSETDLQRKLTQLRIALSEETSKQEKLVKKHDRLKRQLAQELQKLKIKEQDLDREIKINQAKQRQFAKLSQVQASQEEESGGKKPRMVGRLGRVIQRSNSTGR